MKIGGTYLHFYLEYKTKDWVRSKINFLLGLQEPYLATIERRTFACFGHVNLHDSLSKTILQGTLEGGGGAHRGRQRKRWLDNIRGWTSQPMLELSQGPPAEKTGRGSLLDRPSCSPTTQSVKGLN